MNQKTQFASKFGPSFVGFERNLNPVVSEPIPYFRVSHTTYPTFPHKLNHRKGSTRMQRLNLLTHHPITKNSEPLIRLSKLKVVKLHLFLKQKTIKEAFLAR
jgi:hypothetical protein